MKPFLILISWGVIIGFAGCGKSPNQNGSPSVRALAESFNNFDDFSALVARSNSTTIYEGLPNNYWERELYDRELKTKQTVKIEGNDFYAGPISASSALVDELRSLAGSKSSFEPFQGPKACGGFHPDWCLVWSDGSETYTVFLCFGCDEMVAYKDGERSIYCDIREESRFESLLNPLHVNRPKQNRQRGN
jgi:hypothetical protein